MFGGRLQRRLTACRTVATVRKMMPGDHPTTAWKTLSDRKPDQRLSDCGPFYEQ
jgi:hypothetical protein